MSLRRTPSQTVGPFYSIGLCRRPENELGRAGTELRGTLFDGAGEPVPDGMIELWDAAGGRWGRCGTDDGGRFAFVVTKPAAPDGQAPHLELLVFARGLLRHQWTRVYFPDEAEANASDPALAGLPPGDRARLVGVQEGNGLRFDVHMQGESATVFFAQ
jgi:protocatechuate 3,4-dioxygenase alpha subunit